MDEGTTPADDGRESMDVDVVIVGAGPAGLAAAIRLRQRNPALSVVVLEKGAAVGAHILSGAVIDPVGLDQLLPDWREHADFPRFSSVTEDRFLIMNRTGAIGVPNRLMPPLMNNRGNLIGSLGALCRWLGERAEETGVDIYPGIAATELINDENGAVIGVATGEMGVLRSGEPGPSFARGMALMAKYVLLAEGARGSLSKQAIATFALDAGKSPQKFGLGLKEVWRVPEGRHRPGLVQHSLGWPLDTRTGGGSFVYHHGDRLVTVGFVVHLDYANPYLSPFNEFQRFKTHPLMRGLLEGAERLSYGARAITEGGWQAVPKLVFPGGALLGCAAGFVNVPRIKGSHNAVLSGMLAADTVVDALAAGRSNDELTAYEDGWRGSLIGRDLLPVRNVKPLWSRFGTYLGIAAGGLDMWCNTLMGWSPFGTLTHRKNDAAALEPAASHRPIDYPKPDGVLTFDRMSSVYVSNTNHTEDQPVHLKVRNPELQLRSEHDVYAGPSTRYCPAGVYEWVDMPDSTPHFQINAQNCVHCKTCDIKDPNQNINWVPPQGGEGPLYQDM